VFIYSLQVEDYATTEVSSSFEV